MNKLILGTVVFVIVVVIVIVWYYYHNSAANQEDIVFSIDPNNHPSTGYCIPVPAVFGVASQVPKINFKYSSDGLYLGDYAVSGTEQLAIIVVEVNDEKFGFIVGYDGKNPIIPNTSMTTVTTGPCTMYSGNMFRGCGLISLKDVLTSSEYNAISTYSSALPQYFDSTETC